MAAETPHASPQKEFPMTIRAIRTVKGTTERLTEGPALAPLPAATADDRENGAVSVMVDGSKTFQPIIGFGGAFTESAAVVLQKMSPPRREEILQAYFDAVDGIGYRLGRLHINSCDFSLGNWACCETAGDVELKTFSMARYEQAILPMLRRAIEIAGEPLTLFASPWSPPGWMKSTGKMNRGGTLLPQYRDAWARYYVRFIQEMEKRGMPIWGLTVQNEPEATQSWDSCLYSAADERDFVRDHLGPTLAKHDLAQVKIIIWDHNRDAMFERAKIAYDDPVAADFIWGVGFHWYCDKMFENVQRVHDLRPDKHLLFTEGCQEGGPHTGEWELGERYGESIIQDLNHWTEGWTDWNLILDETGGPNHVGNLCSAPILADTRTDTVLRQSSYYYLGHFSKFIRPGAVRLLCASARDALESTAFRNPDGTVAVVVMNRTEADIPFRLRCPGQCVDTHAPPRSIATFLVA
jgi:glucosylceramidase